MKRGHRMKHHASRQFDAWADSYDRSLLNRFLFKPAYLVFLEELARWYQDYTRPIDLLDVGCGTGTFEAMVSQTMLPVRVVGLDYAEPMCRVASDKARQEGVADGVSFVNGDSEHMPFDDGSFDVVTCANSFHHYPHQQAVIHDMKRVLRPGGRLMLIDGFRDNIIGWFVFDVVIAMVEKHVHHAPWTQIHEYFTEAGLTSIQRRKFNYWFPLLLTSAQS
jgi:ubiquinone/menaquinone biosynthesis C-methylase UbiE